MNNTKEIIILSSLDIVITHSYLVILLVISSLVILIRTVTVTEVLIGVRQHTKHFVVTVSFNQPSGEDTIIFHN